METPALMGNWYKVTKRINGRLYDYWQRTYRVGNSVKTQNKYIGPTGVAATAALATYDRLSEGAQKLYDYGNSLPREHPDKHAAIDRYKRALEAASKFQEQALGRQIDQWGSPKGSGGGQLYRRDFAKELKTLTAKSLIENIPTP
jgi:hypothetical protein